jgi:hypothetical protein
MAGLPDESTSCLHFASFLWHYLLTDARFRDGFTSGLALDEAQLAELWDRLESEIIGLHLEQAKILLSSGRAELAGVHLSCLRDWDMPPNTNYAVDERAHVPKPDGFDEQLGRRLQQRATKAYGAWVDDVILRADEARMDGERMRALHSSVRCAYQAGIDIVRAALSAVPEDLRLAVYDLDQANEYAWDFAAIDKSRAREILVPMVDRARAIAREHFTPGQLAGPNGDVLKRTFSYAWQLEEEETERVRRLEEYLAWNGPDPKAELILFTTRAAVALRDGEPEEAIRLLDNVSLESADIEERFLYHLGSYQARESALSALLGGIYTQLGDFWHATPEERDATLARAANLAWQALESVDILLTMNLGKYLDENSLDALQNSIQQLRTFSDRLPWSLIRGVAVKVLEEGLEEHYVAVGDYLGETAAEDDSETRDMIRTQCYLKAVEARHGQGDFTGAVALLEKARAISPHELSL